MLLGRLFAYADAHRARMGVNYKQIPVNRPQVPGAQLQQGRGDAGPERVRSGVRAELQGRPEGRRRALSRRRRSGTPSGEFIRAAYTLRKDDDDWGQAGTLVRKVMDDAAARPTGVQRRRAPRRRASPSRCCSARSNTGATSTRRSATGSRKDARPDRKRMKDRYTRNERRRSSPSIPATETRGRMRRAQSWRGIRVYTIGHSTRTLDELVALLRTFGVSLLADIRTIPRSRHNPQFNGDALPSSLRRRGLRYVHLPTTWRAAPGPQGVAQHRLAQRQFSRVR